MRINAHCKDCKHDVVAEQKLFEEIKIVECKAGKVCKCEHKNFYMLATTYFAKW